MAKGVDGSEKNGLTAAVLVLLLMNAAALPELRGAAREIGCAVCGERTGALCIERGREAPAGVRDQKIMTMLLAMEALERGEVTLDTMITGSEYACSMGGTQIWLEPGEQLTLDEMLKAIAVGSANDCAVAVAEHLAGTGRPLSSG